VGTNVLIGGLGLQVATFVWFLAIVARFWGVTRHVVRDGAPSGWPRVLQAIMASSVLILVCSPLVRWYRDDRKAHEVL